MEKKTTKRRVVAITILASLLVALLAFNVTYAYFTDRISGSAQITFGKVSLSGTFSSASSTQTNVFPGATVGITGTVDVSQSTDTVGVWVYFGVDADDIEMKIGSTPIANGVVNPNYHDSTGDEHEYTTSDVSAMKLTVEDAIISALATAINEGQGSGNDQNPTAWHVDTSTVAGTSLAGMTSAAVPINTTAFNFANAGNFELDANAFGNLFQGVTISFKLVIKAVQGSNVTKAQAIQIFGADDTDFITGEDLTTPPVTP